MKVRAPLKSKAPCGYTETDIDVIDPLSLAHYLFNVIGLDISPHLCQEYWGHFRSRGAGWATHSSASSLHVPMSLYGDDCKIRQKEKMVGIFLSFPLWRPRTVRCSKFLLCAVQDELLYRHVTLDKIFRYLVWALNCLHIGRYPRCGIDGGSLDSARACKAGQEIAPGRCFAIAEVKGDWAWFKKIFRFQSSWKGGSKVPVCFHCRAFSQRPRIYYEVGEDSECWSSEYGAIDWLLEQCPLQPSAMVNR